MRRPSGRGPCDIRSGAGVDEVPAQQRHVAKDGPGAEVKRVKNTTCKAAKRAARKGDYTQYPYGWAIPRWSCKVVGHYSEGSYTKCSHRGKKLVVRAGA